MEKQVFKLTGKEIIETVTKLLEYRNLTFKAEEKAKETLNWSKQDSIKDYEKIYLRSLEDQTQEMIKIGKAEEVKVKWDFFKERREYTDYEFHLKEDPPYILFVNCRLR